MTDVALAPLLDAREKRRGVFSPACFIHTSFNLSMPLIGGDNYMTAFSSFYFQSEKPVEASSYKLSDTCGLMCNPSCP